MKPSAHFCWNKVKCPPYGRDTWILTGYDIHLVCSSTEINCTASDFMKWPIDVFATTQYIMAVCSMNCWGGGVLYLTGSIGVVELDLTARVAKLHTKDHFLFFCLFVIFHTFIFFVLQYQECLIYQPNLALILGTPVSLMTHSQRYLLFIRRFNPVCK